VITFDQLRDRLYRYASLEHADGASVDEIAQVERRLKISLPGDYVSFLREFGWIGLEGMELYGVGSGVPTHWELCLNVEGERTMFMPFMPTFLIPVMADGAGNHYCLDTSRLEDGRCPVVFWDHEDPRGNRQIPQVVAASFVEWLWNHLNELESFAGDEEQSLQ